MKRHLITWVCAVLAVLGTLVLGAKLDAEPIPRINAGPALPAPSAH